MFSLSVEESVSGKPPFTMPVVKRTIANGAPQFQETGMATGFAPFCQKKGLFCSIS